VYSVCKKDIPPTVVQPLQNCTLFY